MNKDLPKLVGSFVKFRNLCKRKKTYVKNDNYRKKVLYDALDGIEDKDSFVDDAFNAAVNSFAEAGKPLSLSDDNRSFLSNLKNRKGHADKCAALHYHILKEFPGRGCELNCDIFKSEEIEGVFEYETNRKLTDSHPGPALELPSQEPIDLPASPPHFLAHDAFDMPDAYVLREEKLREIKNVLLDPENGGSVALTTMLHGFGGFGKSTLAKAIYNDPAVRDTFSNGVFWVQCQQDKSLKVESLIASVLPEIDLSAQVSRCVDGLSTRRELARVVGDKRILLIVDDVWYEAHAAAFRGLPATCAVLMTTRMKHLALPGSIPVHVDEMTPDEAVGILKWWLDRTAEGTVSPFGESELSGLKKIAHQLGYWAQLLGLANGWLRRMRAKGFALAQAANDYLSLLAAKGVVVTDSGDTSGSAQEARARNMQICIEASLDMFVGLFGEERLSRFLELGVLPKDSNVPMAVIADLWRERVGLIDAEAESRELLASFADMSLLEMQVHSGNRCFIGLHDNLIDYLNRRLGAQGRVEANRAVVASLRRHCPAGWETLPANHEYGWTHLLTHLAGANEREAADNLRTDFEWLKAKLGAVGAHELARSFSPSPESRDARLVGRAVFLSLPAISLIPGAFAHQMIGRLARIDHSEVRSSRSGLGLS